MSQDLAAAFGEESAQRTPEVLSGQKKQRTDHDRTPGYSNVSGVSKHAPDYREDEKAVHSISQRLDEDDDFGDFEDASAPTPVAVTTSKFKESRKTEKKPLPFAPRPTVQEPRIGRHPFAGHMDLLFDADDDEYDAGADELGDLATNPEAAMAYSKRLIAEQEAAQLRKGGHEGSRDSPHDLARRRDLPVNSSKDEARKPPRATSSAPTSQTNRRQQKSANILFDAEDLSASEGDTGENDDADWGDFENGSAS